MQEVRRNRMAALILEELSLFIRSEIKDPRVHGVTLTRVELTQDARQATVYYSLLSQVLSTGVEGRSDAQAEELEQKSTQTRAGLEKASGFMHRYLGKILQVRHVPKLVFKEDRGLENTLRVENLLRELNLGETATATATTAEPSETDPKTPKE